MEVFLLWEIVGQAKTWPTGPSAMALSLYEI